MCIIRVLNIFLSCLSTNCNSLSHVTVHFISCSFPCTSTGFVYVSESPYSFKWDFSIEMCCLLLTSYQCLVLFLSLSSRTTASQEPTEGTWQVSVVPAEAHEVPAERYSNTKVSYVLLLVSNLACKASTHTSRWWSCDFPGFLSKKSPHNIL